MKYAIYARVSPKGSGFESETSIDMQIQLCKDFVKQQRGDIVEIQTDEFFSGKDMKRPGFQKLINDLKNGIAEWDCICIYKLSRLTRSRRDGDVIFDLLKEWNKGFVSVTEPNFDFSTPMGRAMLSIFQAFNQFEREQTAENTLNKMISIAEKGLWPVGNPPFGYRRGEKHDNLLYIDPRNAEKVKDIFTSYAEDVPLFKIARKHERHAQSILYILRNEVYLGKIYYSGRTYEGKHQPIISQVLFDAVRKKLPQQIENETHFIRPKQQKRPYLFSGIIRCHCGKYMTPESAKSGRYYYYRCTDNINCKARLKAEDIEEKIIRIVLKEAGDIDFIRGYRDEIRNLRKERIEKSKPELDNVNKALLEAKSEQEKLYALFMNGVVMSNNAKYFNDKLASFQKEIADLTARKESLLAIIQRDENEIPDAMEKIADDIISLGDVFVNFPEDPEQRRKIILSTVQSVQILTDEHIKVTFHIPKGSSSKKENGCPTWI